MDRLQLLLLACVGMLVLWLAWQGAKVWLRRGIRVDTAALTPEMPTLLYFSSESCAPCRLQQAPTIDVLRQRMDGRARFQEYDALEHPDLVRRYKVLTVPTTVVVAPCGDVVAVNYGVTQADKLRHQLDEAEDACG
jgi:thioredoxin-like negative regulator of GroEL